MVVNWAMIQAFKAPALKTRRYHHQSGLSTSPCSPRVIEILDKEVCTCIAPVTLFTVDCVLF